MIRDKCKLRCWIDYVLIEKTPATAGVFIWKKETSYLDPEFFGAQERT